MIHNILWNVAEAKQCTTHVQPTGDTSSHVYIIPDTLNFGSVNKIARTDNLPNQIIIILTAAFSFESKLSCDVHEL